MAQKGKWVFKLMCEYLALRRSLSAFALCTALIGCQSSDFTKQGDYAVRPSLHAEILPEDHTVAKQYVPSGLRDSPNSPVAYHTPPSVSYEDQTFDNNLAGSLELVDYYKAVQKAGLQYVLQARGPFTVIAIANEALESYSQRWKGGLFAPYHHDAFVYFIKQTIIEGDWSPSRLRTMAKGLGGVVRVKTLAGTQLTFQLQQDGDIVVVGAFGRLNLQPTSYPQLNGTLYVADSVLPSNGGQ